MRKIIRNIIAIILLIIGFIGGFIPVLQGWIFVLTGFILLDFKKKHIIEQKIIEFFKKFKITKRLAELWERVKKKNKDVLISDEDKKMKKIYHEIHKNIKK